jgi:cysteinyl-tRNA synthetase
MLQTTIEIYNSLSKQKELLLPIVPEQIGLYVCGITVYDFYHLGHARTYLVFDMVVRYLRYRGFKVKYVRNITDIDDKIIQRALENNEPYEALTARFIKAVAEDERALNILEPDVVPRATEFIDAMIHLIGQMIEKDYAYVAPNGDVYYDVLKSKSYGCLAHRDVEDMQAGARVDVNEAKRNPMDFVLWKSAKPGEPEWNSPWGKGRPGWHTECSAMSLAELGETFDIHGGGADLKFPHHENERAQSEAVTAKNPVNIWMHSGFLQINEEKMSKSLGNFLTVRDFLKEYNPEVLRYFTLASHYRSPVEYSDESLHSAVKGLERLYTAIRGLSMNNDRVFNDPAEVAFAQRFENAMDDDFNTPVALSILFDIARELNKVRTQDLKQAEALGGLLKTLASSLGLLYQDPEIFLQSAIQTEVDVQTIQALIQAREEARKTKQWAEADRVRDQLTGLGVVLEDTATGTLWRKG